MNKVRVVKLFGGSSAMGAMNPKIGMMTHLGKIVALTSGNMVATVSGANAGTFTQVHPYFLEVLESHATGVHAFPTGDGSIKHGHKNFGVLSANS